MEYIRSIDKSFGRAASARSEAWAAKRTRSCGLALFGRSTRRSYGTGGWKLTFFS